MPGVDGENGRRSVAFPDQPGADPGRRLTDAVEIAGRTAPSRVLFGPHETNLGQGRGICDRHVAYYARRAAGGAGIVVVETASVTADDRPYERSPLAADCRDGWAAVAAACQSYGTLVLAGLGHAGGQGSSAHSQSVLWAPSRVADVGSRELPAEMEQPEIDAVVAGFGDAARGATHAGLDGVEVDAGAFSLVRQFLSGLTNQRGDHYGDDRLSFLREVLHAVRRGLGPDRILSLRLSCDELAPWAGVTPEHAAGFAAELADGLDLLVVVRGGPYSTSAYRPDGHTAAGFNTGLAASVRAAVAGRVPVVLQGSVVDPAAAQAALDDGAADLVEMTRAQIADADLVRTIRVGHQPRPCILCNQACKVRDDRNPIVSCVVDPTSGYETTEIAAPAGPPGDVLVVGAGPAGLECARVLAGRGHHVRVAERSGVTGGALRLAAVPPGRERFALLADWLTTECERLGVRLELGAQIHPGDLEDAAAAGVRVVIATGSTAVRRTFGAGATPDGIVLDAAAALALDPAALPAGAVVVHDPVGGPTGIGVAEWLAAAGREAVLVTGDQVAGTQLARTGDLADANVRLQRAGVRRELRALLRSVVDGRAVLEDVWTGERREIACDLLIDCGHRVPDETLAGAEVGGAELAGDRVAPRSVLEAVLEGRRIAEREMVRT